MSDLADQIDDYICTFDGIGDLTMDTLAMLIFAWAVLALFLVWLCKFLYNKYVKKSSAAGPVDTSKYGVSPSEKLRKASETKELATSKDIKVSGPESNRRTLTRTSNRFVYDTWIQGRKQENKNGTMVSWLDAVHESYRWPFSLLLFYRPQMIAAAVNHLFVILCAVFIRGPCSSNGARMNNSVLLLLIQIRHFWFTAPDNGSWPKKCITDLNVLFFVSKRVIIISLTSFVELR